MAFSMAVKMCTPTISSSRFRADGEKYRLQSGCDVIMLPSQEATVKQRRLILGCCSFSLAACLFSSLASSPSWAGEESKEDKDEGVVGAIKTLFDPNERTKSGKVLPKAYLKSAREVLKTLRESLKEDSKDATQFRRTADAAKESIREYLNGWKGQKAVVNEESYAIIEKAIRSLANFYAKAGPSAPLPEDIKSEILGDLNTAEQFL